MASPGTKQMTTSGERVNADPVALGGEGLDVAAQRGRVGGEQLGPLDLGHGVAVRLEEVGHRGLAVDDDVTPARQVDDGVGPDGRARGG